MIKAEISYSFKFPQDQVFDAFLNIEAAKNFLFRTEAGKLVKAELNPEVGGSFEVTEKRGEQEVGHFGTFVEIEKPERLSFIFSVMSPDSDSVFTELTFKKFSGGCELHLSQEVKPEFAEMKAKIAQGWSAVFDSLDKYLTSQESSTNAIHTKDSQGNTLLEGDSVKTIKDLKVKGSSMVIKRGTIVKKIHLISGNDEEVDCKVDGVALALETQWLVRI